MDSGLSTIDTAKALLGMRLNRSVEGIIYSGLITETEAYLSPDDIANHSARGRTKRTEPMFGEPGTIYVYLIYGMYYCLNIVTGPIDHPEAVLIRGLQLERPDVKNLNGPGKLCRELHITSELSGTMLGKEVGLWLEKGRAVKESEIMIGPRVGLRRTPEPWHSAPLRFRTKE